MNGKPLSFEKTYKLIPQTPLIHFQHRQSGATLRASEVKPKLDKFLLEKAKTEGLDTTGWFVGETKALNYKLRFVDAEKNTPKDISKYKFYFGKDGKGLIFKNVTMKVICINKSLREHLDKYIKEFFILNNFGTRQSKGFGGFWIEGTTDEDIDAAIKGIDYFEFSVDDGDDLALFKRAVDVYAVMKGGINGAGFNPYVDGTFLPQEGRYLKPNAYVKGFIQRPFLNESVGSDKAFIKSRVLKTRQMTYEEKTNPVLSKRFGDNLKKHNNYLYIRAILGLAGHYEYRDDIHCDFKETKYNRNNQPYATYYEKKVYVYSFDNVTVAESGNIVPPEEIEKDIGIKRFKSPITIKIFTSSAKKRVIFLFDDSYKLVLDKTFIFLTERQKKDFEAKVKANNYKEAAAVLKKCKAIKTPETFDKKDFIRRFVEYFNSKDVKTRLEKCGSPSKNIVLKQKKEV